MSAPAALSGDTAPRVLSDLPQLEIDGQLIVAHEAVNGLLLLDPVFTVLYRSLDGRTTLGTLADDLATVDGVSADRAEWIVRTFVEGLQVDGFLAGDDTTGYLPRRVYAPITRDSCVGRRIGLGRAELVHVAGDHEGLRIGSTVPGVLDRIRGSLATESADEAAAIETIVLRASGSPRSTRAQRVVDTLARVLYEGQSIEVAVEAFERTVSGRLELVDGGTWLEGPVLERDWIALLVAPAIADLVFHEHRRALADAGFACLPGAFTEMLRDGGIRLPADRFSGRPSRRLHLGGALVGASPDPAASLRELLHLCRHWDHAHLDRMGEVSRQLEYVAVPPPGATGREWVACAEAAVASPPPRQR